MGLREVHLLFRKAIIEGHFLRDLSQVTYIIAEKLK